MKNIHVSLNKDQSYQPFTIKRFEELFDLHYLEQLEFKDWKTEQWIRNRCHMSHQKGKMGQLALWLGKIHGYQIDQANIPDVSIRWISDQIGYGLFTNKPLKKWEFIGEYTGILRERNLFFRNINDYCFMYPRAWISLKAFTIDSKKHGNFTRFINHSDTPNCESVSVFHNGIFHIIFRTIKEISEGSQLTYDYGSIYWQARKKLPEPPLEELMATEALELLKR